MPPGTPPFGDPRDAVERRDAADAVPRVRCVGRLTLSSPLAADDLTMLAALTHHWRPDGPASLVPCGDVSPQAAAESLRRIQSMVLGPRGIRLRGSVLVVGAGKRFGTISVRHGRVTSRQLHGRRAPIQADPTVHIDLAMPRESAAEPASEVVYPTSPTRVGPVVGSSASPDPNLPGNS